MALKLKDTIFDSTGSASLFWTNTGEFIDLRGNCLGFLDGKAVFDFNGTQRGWFEAGILRDPQSHCVGFVENATSIVVPPLPSVKKVYPPKIKTAPPLRPAEETGLKKPRPDSEWSEFDPVSLFQVVCK